MQLCQSGTPKEQRASDGVQGAIEREGNHFAGKDPSPSRCATTLSQRERALVFRDEGLGTDESVPFRRKPGCCQANRSLPWIGGHRRN